MSRSITFLNLNLWCGGLLFPKIIYFLRRYQPDIMTFQEVRRSNSLVNKPHNLNTINSLRKIFPNYYYQFAPAFLAKEQNNEFESGNLTVSRFPLKNPRVIFFDVPYGEVQLSSQQTDFSRLPRHMLYVETSINNKLITIANIHGIWGSDGKDNRRRLKMADQVVNTLKDKKNVILSGDFNLQPTTHTIAKIERYLVNVFKDELTTSFNMKRKINPGYATAVVDMLFISQNIKVIDHICPNVDISDHLPLLARLEI